MNARSLTWALLPCLLTVACTDSVVAPDRSPPNNADVFDQLWRETDLHYSFFGLKAVDWNAARAAYRPRAVAAQSDRELALVLTEMLGELRDPHVSFTPFGRGSTRRHLSHGDTTATGFSVVRTIDRYCRGGGFKTDRELRYAEVDSLVGYLHIGSFYGNGWAAQVEDALAALQHVKALIVDVRNNGGGTYSLAVDIAGRFASHPQRFGYLRLRNGRSHEQFTGFVEEVVRPNGKRRFTGPVVLLTNRRTVSSAEVFSLAMRALPNVVVVGDTTAGASGGPTGRQLSNGWIYELSEWIEYTDARTPFEDIGLAPDILVRQRWSATDSSDVTMERAIEVAHSVLLPNADMRAPRERIDFPKKLDTSRAPASRQ